MTEPRHHPLQNGYPSSGQSTPSTYSKYKKFVLPLVGLLALGLAYTSRSADSVPSSVFEVPVSPQCKKAETYRPSFNKSVNLILNDKQFKIDSIKKLSGAIQIPTEINDTNPLPDDDLEYYAEFFKLHKYFEETFPLVHAHLKVEKVNKIGLIYTWEGTDPSLKPILFMAHQDVVPVNREIWDSWEYPPFSGHYDPETDYVWGRGSNDCKNLLLAELEGIEQLLADGYSTKRTVILSLGFDEESSGLMGASTLAPFLLERYGPDSMFSIIDEGAGLLRLDKNLYIAAAVNAEKGYVDAKIAVHGHGGHSSVQPDHTTIGVASELIFLMENHPFEFNFSVDNPVYNVLQCAAEHSSFFPPHVRDAILRSPVDENQRRVLTEFAGSHPDIRDLIRTTRAIDVINGGVKANALPGLTSFIVNHRVGIHSSVNETVENDLYWATVIAKKHGYGLTFQDEVIIPETKLGYISLACEKMLEPAPISPTSGHVWDIFAGTVQNLFQNEILAEQKDAEVYVTGGLFSGNTDTKYYWDLSRNIYRFVAGIFPFDQLRTIHSVNEHISASSHVSAVAFVYEYIVNVNEYGHD
ncbi:M20 family metallopeptidase SKDI_15G0100 [Saccharomyces kudriavzevii IFO 1802]|uniref:Uncharacterized protein n=2 Tax=Saccharomyces kudriavzevii (strain ATCC MYA-4449 / AS 2.2408 / CBS 8840 / NBRC 1802 / NCYC 2889) TaxID=226230 RepID=A0AA35J6L8_SACK1|nr:uncharacterized protein SKDI_15G0100 [Saccharomyces kudriavzevii IFO 1802]EJT41756.1 YOL153C-like protein [Saccharomyces kudriavzevii IFO 1802]CAI4050723.1 hypothetical protein SKDI_15G0100 [Saccharomyces kudriavzevii IFO 1802]